MRSVTRDAGKWPFSMDLSVSLFSREGNPPKKPPTQTNTVRTNSLCKLFLPVSVDFKGKGGTICANSSEIVRERLFCFKIRALRVMGRFPTSMGHSLKSPQ